MTVQFSPFANVSMLALALLVLSMVWTNISESCADLLAVHDFWRKEADERIYALMAEIDMRNQIIGWQDVHRIDRALLHAGLVDMWARVESGRPLREISAANNVCLALLDTHLQLPIPGERRWQVAP